MGMTTVQLFASCRPSCLQAKPANGYHNTQWGKPARELCSLNFETKQQL
jgi:hypothetical protein